LRRAALVTALATTTLLLATGGTAVAGPGPAAGAGAHNPYAAAARTLSAAQLADRHRTALAAGPTVLARGLNSPRQLALTVTGGLVVGEAGRGGDACVTFPVNGVPTESCLGTTGAISWIPVPSLQTSPLSYRVLSGLLSRADRAGIAATGPGGVSGRTVADLQIAVAQAPPVPGGPDLGTAGKLLRSTALDAPQVTADISGHEIANDPDGQGPDSNPNGVLVLPGRVLVADAAANTVLQWEDGQLSTFAVLPNVHDGNCAGVPNQGGTTGCDFVPTALAAGPGGSVYVSSLSNLVPGAAQIVRLDGRTGAILQTWTGLSGVMGVATGPDGSLYASQLFAGSVVRIHPDGTRTTIPVPFPSGLAVDGSHLYVSAYSIAPETGLGAPGVDSSGQVWRLDV
jgi:hypothetical protein